MALLRSARSNPIDQLRGKIAQHGWRPNEWSSASQLEGGTCSQRRSCRHDQSAFSETIRDPSVNRRMTTAAASMSGISNRSATTAIATSKALFHGSPTGENCECLSTTRVADSSRSLASDSCIEACANRQFAPPTHSSRANVSLLFSLRDH
jgi:hypothetical protein